jgi:hypothetical protein
MTKEEAIAVLMFVLGCGFTTKLIVRDDKNIILFEYGRHKGVFGYSSFEVWMDIKNAKPTAARLAFELMLPDSH